MSNEKRNRVVKVRLSDAEWDTLNGKKSHPELARWIRETVLAVEPTKETGIWSCNAKYWCSRREKKKLKKMMKNVRCVFGLVRKFFGLPFLSFLKFFNLF